MNSAAIISDDFIVQRIVQIAETGLEGDLEFINDGIRRMFNKASLAGVAKKLGVDHNTTPTEFYLSAALEQTEHGKQFVAAVKSLYLLTKDDAELRDYFTSFDRPEDIFIEKGDAEYVEDQFENVRAWSNKIFGTTVIGKQALVNALNFG